MTETTNTKLIAELREQSEHELHFETSQLFRQTAAALEALQAEVERLKDSEKSLQEYINRICGAVPGYEWVGTAEQEIAKVFSERDMWKATANAVVDFEKIELRKERDALQADRERLLKELGDLPEAQSDMLSEIKALRAQLAAAHGQKPVATVKAKSDAYGGTFVHWTALPVVGMKLYAAPIPQQLAEPSAPEVNAMLVAFVEEYVEAWQDGMAGDGCLLSKANAALTAAQQSQPAEPFTPRELVLMNEDYVHAKQFGFEQQPQPERAPLSDDEIKEITADNSIDSIHAVVRAVEAAHGIKEVRNSEPVFSDRGPITAIIGVGLEYRPDEHERLEWREEMGICLEYADGYRDCFYISELSVVKGGKHD